MDKLIDIISTVIALTVGLVVMYIINNSKPFTVTELLVFIYVTHIGYIIIRKNRD